MNVNPSLAALIGHLALTARSLLAGLLAAAALLTRVLVLLAGFWFGLVIPVLPCLTVAGKHGPHSHLVALTLRFRCEHSTAAV